MKINKSGKIMCFKKGVYCGTKYGIHDFFPLATTILDKTFGTKKRNPIKLDTQESLKSTFVCFLAAIGKIFERNSECQIMSPI